MKIDGIGHLALRCHDMEKSLAFYCGVLGMEKAFSLDVDGKRCIEYLKVAPRQFLELFYDYEGGVVEGSFAHLCLHVEDIFEVEKALLAAGWPVDIAPKQGLDTNWQCWATDPDGNKIEFMQLSPESPQAKA